MSTNKSLKSIETFLAKRVRSHLRDHGRLTGIRFLEVREHHCSTVARVDLIFEANRVDAFLKIHGRAGDERRREYRAWAEKEFRLLDALCTEANQHRGLRVVKPLLFLPDLPGVLMEHRSDTILNSLLRKRRFGPFGRGVTIERLSGCYRNAGRSLKELHRATAEDDQVRSAVDDVTAVHAKAGRPAYWKLETLLQIGDGWVERVQPHCRNGQSRRMEPLYRSSRDEAASILRDGYRRVGVHGDFTPLNVFVSGTQVTFFDFVNFHAGHPFVDVGRFLSYTYFLAKDALAYSRRQVSELMAAFMDGYGLQGWRSDPVLRFFFQWNMCRVLAAGLRFSKRRWPLNALYRVHMLRVFEHWIGTGMTVP